jgi:hypothetical protein
MARDAQDRRQSIDYAWQEADRCGALAEQAGSAEARAVYGALRDSWIRIANSLESTEKNVRGEDAISTPGGSRTR